jgi:nucleoside-diphosphate-sugar epimerase
MHRDVAPGPAAGGARVVVTGAAGGVGQRVLRLLSADPTVAEVVALDIVRDREDLPKVTHHVASVATADLEPLVAGATSVVHLAFAVDTERRRRHSEATNVDGTRRLLAAMAATDVRHIVAMSSALAYGAWPNNPVPLTEDAPVRPNPGFAYAVQQAQREHLVAEWVEAAPARVAAVMRPCVGLGPDRSPWLAASLAAAAGMRVAQEDPPAQFLHLDDLARAIDLARSQRLDGVYNVAPDGWMSGETVRALAVARPRLRLPGRIAVTVAKLRWRFQRGPIPPGMLPFTQHPWVVASDRLRARGWTPRFTSEQAYVAGTEAKWWTLLTPSRKQELALGAAAAGGVGVVGIVAGVVRKVVRSRR